MMLTLMRQLAHPPKQCEKKHTKRKLLNTKQCLTDWQNDTTLDNYAPQKG